MILRSLTLDFFRNYLHFEGSFSPGVNVIWGENAQGKTNLLEAAAYLSTASSHRARYDKELIQFGVDHAFLQGEVEARGRTFALEARLSREGRRQLFSNGVRLKSAAELSGVLNTVLFCPEDLYLIREGHKTRILRDWEERPGLLDTLDEFSLRMAQTGALIIHYRAHFIKRLREVTPPIHADFSGGREALDLRYETVSTVADPLAPARTILEQLLAHQESHRKAELEARQCLSGPHKDDLAVELDGRSAKQFASQGQTRTAALSLKLASREIFFHETGEWPVLLLDDVLSELDARRQEFVLRRITGGQVFISCCEEMDLDRLGEGKTFHIKGGALV